eukprot:9479382-Pyramimonas_sp.AAC.1
MFEVPLLCGARRRPCPIHCVTDLGNVHDCLRNLELYAAAGLVTVAADADIAFLGYGVSPNMKKSNI